MTNLYQNPEVEFQPRRKTDTEEDTEQTQPTRPTLPKKEIEEQFEAFYKDIFVECALIGEVDEITVCENHNDHLNGNTYVRFRTEDAAQRARDSFSSRWYNGRPVYCDLSPVGDLRDASCRQHDTQSCERGGMCNFMHVKRPSRALLKQLKLSQRKFYEDQYKNKTTTNQPEESKVENVRV